MIRPIRTGGRPREVVLADFGRRLDYLLSLPANRARFPVKKAFLAELPIEPPTLRKYEIGEREPTGPLVAHIADLLGTTTDYLLGRTEDPRPSASAPMPEPAPYPAFVEFAERDPKGQEMTAEERAMFSAIRLPPGNEPSPDLYLHWLLSFRLYRNGPRKA